ncbi:unnamed protein product [Blepharisma stoltei]|uniref:Uncharacterized protein n=1 Tax=Blepharisma stoltei TaxID=1481888 RepID=A0AAU9IJ23_9CILI|nr:unnamed protein product [Blepharisma stoltei]
MSLVDATYVEQFSNPFYRFHPSTIEETPNGLAVLGHNFVASLIVKYDHLDKALANALSLKIDQEMKRVSDSLHHKVIIPELSDKFAISTADAHHRLNLREGKEHLTFPERASVIVPISDCSLREIANYFGRRILEQVGVQEFVTAGVKKIKVEINYNESMKKASATFDLRS